MAQDSPRLAPGRVAQIDDLVEGAGRGGGQPPDGVTQSGLGGAGRGPALDAEHSAHDHVQRDRLHARREREALADRPAVDLALGDLGDHLHVALHRVAVKRRQQQLALAQVPVPDRREDRVGPEDRAQGRFAGQRGGVARLGLQQRLDVIGVAGDHERLAPRDQMQLPDVTVAPARPEVECHRTGAEANRLQPRRGRIGRRQADRDGLVDGPGRRRRGGPGFSGGSLLVELWSGRRAHGTALYRTRSVSATQGVSNPSAPAGR